MKILAVEFSSDQRSVAIVEGDMANWSLRGLAQETGGRNTRAFALIEDALQQAKVEREEIDCIAVGLGPGSYTGIRAAIALAQGWQLARGIKLVGIGVVEVLAAQAQTLEMRGLINIVIDAQRNEFYLATYELDGRHFYEKEPLRIVAVSEVEMRIAQHQIAVGPEIALRFPNAKDIFPEAATLGKLALGKTEFVEGEKLEPVYLREVSFVKAPPSRII